MTRLLNKSEEWGRLHDSAADTYWPEWYRWLEIRRRFLIGAAIIVCVAVMFGSALRNPVDYDSFWHAQMGKDWLEKGLTPYLDHYSFTYQGERVKGPPVVFQAWLYLMEDMLGETAGKIVVKLVSFLLVFACILFWLRQLKAPVLVYWLAFAMLVFLLQIRSQVRPELISYSFSIVALMLYRQSNLRLSPKTILPIGFLLVLWSNYHASILGYIIFFGLFVDIAWRQIREQASFKEWLHWCAWGAFLVAVGFINHDLAHPFIDALTFPDYWKTSIREYLSPMVFYEAHWSMRFFMLPLAFITLLAALRYGMVGYAISGAIILYSALTIGRMVTPGGIVLIGLFAHVFSIAANHRATAKPAWQFNASGVMSAIILVAVMWENVAFVRYNLFNNQSLLFLYPKDMIEYIKTNERYGRMFNEYSIGGYLIERLYPDIKVYIDGRTNILYPPRHMQKYMDARYDSVLMTKEINKYGIEHVVLGNEPFDALMMTKVNGFALDYVDAKYSLYTKEKPGLSKTGELWARPACSNEDLLTEVAAELEALNPSLYTSAGVISAIAVVSDYASKSDEGKKEWLSTINIEEVSSDYAKRYAAYRAIELGLDEEALKFFNALSLKVYSDELALAFIYAQKGLLEEAGIALNRSFELNRDWWMFESKDFAVMALVAEMMGSGSPPLQVLDNAFSDKIRAKVQQYGLQRIKNEINIPALFCGVETRGGT